MHSQEPVLRVEGLYRRYGSLTAVDHISFEVYKGEFFSLLGPSGCGKSTILRLIAGLEAPDSGEIWLSGTAVFSTVGGIFVPPEKRNIGLVFQSYAVWPHMTVEENVSYPLEVRRWDKREIQRSTRKILEEVGLGGLENRPATHLSGGQQQRLALARSLVYEPDLLLLDEPLSNVDAKLREQLRVELKKLQQSVGVTIIYVTHDQTEAMSLSRRIAVINEGRIEQIDGPKEIYINPASFFVQTFIGRLITFQGRIIERDSRKLIEVPRSGYLEMPKDTSASVNQKVCIATRPEDIQIEIKEHEPSLHQIAATVQDATDLGSHYEYTIMAAGTEFVMETPPGINLVKGKRILLGLKAAKIWPL